MLTNNDYLLEDVILLKNPQLTQKILEQTNFRCNSETIDVKSAMEAGDIDNVRALVQYGRGWKTRRTIFEREILRLIDSNDLASASVFFKQLPNWNIVDENFVLSLRFLFEEGTHEVVRMLLECKIVEHMKEKFGMEMLVNVFGNPKVNVTELLENRKFDVNTQGVSGETALHCAVENDLVKNVRFLLDHGADPNSRDCVGWTPLFVVKSTECMELLLECGANLQSVDKDGYTIFDSLEMFSEKMTKAALANLALTEARGTTVQQIIRDKIKSKESFKAFYESCRQEIEWMEEQQYDLFLVLTESTENVANNFSNSEHISSLLDRTGNVYVNFMLEKKLNRILGTVNSQQKATDVFFREKDVHDPYHDIAAKIVNHTTFEDLLVYFFIFFISIRILF